MILRESTSDRGFSQFGFHDFADHAHLREVHAGWHQGGERIFLTLDDQANLMVVMQDCLVEACLEFLTQHGQTVADFDWVLLSQYSTEWVQQAGDRMSIDRDKLIDLATDQHGNPSSSSVALAISEGLRLGSMKPGDTLLIAQVCPGVQVGCAVYQV